MSLAPDTSHVGSPEAKAYDDGYAAGFNGDLPRYARRNSARHAAYDRGYADGCKARARANQPVRMR
jgi:hypothetical protein